MKTAAEDLADRITRHLDRSLTVIDPHVLARLRAARETALERGAARPAWALSAANGAAPALGRNPPGPLTRTRLVWIGFLIAAICGTVYWQRVWREDPVDIDMKLLSSDLPIDAYLDKGLDAWLTR